MQGYNHKHVDWRIFGLQGNFPLRKIIKRYSEGTCTQKISSGASDLTLGLAKTLTSLLRIKTYV